MHPKKKRGNFHIIRTQFQLHPPIAVSVEVSKTFVNMYPNCARKNILMPYPNIDGTLYNGALEVIVNEKLQKLHQHSSTRNHQKLLSQYYSGGNHGTCRNLRLALSTDFECSPSGLFIKEHQEVEWTYIFGYKSAIFCPCPGGDSPSAKRMFDVLHSGCIPVIISHDFVWPFTSEFDAINTTNQSLDPNEFSIRLQADVYSKAAFDSRTCHRLDGTNSNNTEAGALQTFLDSISASEILHLQNGVKKASRIYSYYEHRPDLPVNPLQAGILPDGGAARMLVQALSERASGKFWAACEEELKGKNPEIEDTINSFKC
jgi:hypothetical protein